MKTLTGEEESPENTESSCGYSEMFDVIDGGPEPGRQLAPERSLLTSAAQWWSFHTKQKQNTGLEDKCNALTSVHMFVNYTAGHLAKKNMFFEYIIFRFHVQNPFKVSFAKNAIKVIK